MADEFKLRCAIVEYVQKLSTNTNSGLDADSLEVALQCLTESLQVNMDSDAYKKNCLGGVSLVSVFTAGLTGEAVAADTSSTEAASSSSSSEPGSVDHWNNYVASKASSGVFAGLLIGSADYQAALKKLSTEYQTTFNLEKAPISSDDISVADKNRADVLKNLGNTLLQKNDAKGAYERYSEAIVLDPTNAVYWCNRAVAGFKLGRHSAAVQDAQQAITIDPKYVKAYYRKGLSLAAQRAYTDAMTAYETAIKLAVEAGDNQLRAEIQRELDNVKTKCKPTKTLPKQQLRRGAGGAGAPAGMDALLNNPNVQAMLNNPDLMKSLGGMLSGDGNSEMDVAALQSVLGGALGNDAPGTENLAEIVNQVKDDPAVEALNDDPQMAAIMKEIELNGPAAAMKYLADPTVMQKIGPLVQKFMSGLKK